MFNFFKKNVQYNQLKQAHQLTMDCYSHFFNDEHFEYIVDEKKWNEQIIPSDYSDVYLFDCRKNGHWVVLYHHPISAVDIIVLIRLGEKVDEIQNLLSSESKTILLNRMTNANASQYSYQYKDSVPIYNKEQCVMLVPGDLCNIDIDYKRLGKSVSLYIVVPIFKEEFEYLGQHGMNKLVEKLKNSDSLFTADLSTNQLSNRVQLGNHVNTCP